MSYVWNTDTVLYIRSMGCRLGRPCNRCRRFAFPDWHPQLSRTHLFFLESTGLVIHRGLGWHLSPVNVIKATAHIKPFTVLDGKATPLAFHWAIRVLAMSVVNCLILSYDEDTPIKWYQSSKFFPLKSYILIPIYIGKGCSLVLSCLRRSDFPFLW